MPPIHKGFKSINHRDVQYRWIIRSPKTGNELTIEASAPVNGQLLVALLPRVVSENMVMDAIDFGNANGWKRNEPGPVFRCKRTSKGFIFADEVT
jgi:hypothetical protein